MTERFPIKKLVLSALFAAPVCVATISIRIPTPGTGGYIHPGDIIVIFCGVSLDPASVFLAAGIDLCMADLLGDYLICVPITFVVKGPVASSAGHICGRLRARDMNPYAAVVGCSIIDIILMAGGYCLYEIFLYGLGVALVSALSNITQGIDSLITSSTLYPILQKPLSMALKA